MAETCNLNEENKHEDAEGGRVEETGQKPGQPAADDKGAQGAQPALQKQAQQDGDQGGAGEAGDQAGSMVDFDVDLEGEEAEREEEARERTAHRRTSPPPQAPHAREG